MDKDLQVQHRFIVTAQRLSLTARAVEEEAGSERLHGGGSTLVAESGAEAESATYGQHRGEFSLQSPCGSLNPSSNLPSPGHRHP
jgi:hypothetical protein